MIHDLLTTTAQWISTLSNVLSTLAIAFGLVQAVVILGKSALRRMPLPGVSARIVLGRWLGMALELALAADIVGTIVAPTWDEIGKLGAIVGLRTVLNYFLAREVREAASGEAEDAKPHAAEA